MMLLALLADTAWDDIADKVAFGVLITVLATFLMKPGEVWGQLGRYGRTIKGLFSGAWRRPFVAELKDYRANLDPNTKLVSHSWTRKHTQSLDGILVPVVVQSKDTGGRVTENVEDFALTLRRRLRRRGRAGKDAPPKTPRIVVVGDPGWGKTVALKTACRLAWELESPLGVGRLVPVLATFADYVRNDYDLEATLAQSMRDFGFGPPEHRPNDLAQRFLRKYLPRGRVLVVLDGLDEINKDEQKVATARISRELNRLSDAPAILSCRKSFWRGRVDFAHNRIEMNGFTPGAIHEFINKWEFEGGKSAGELWSEIKARPHLEGLARNPLMLSIIAYLYDHPNPEYRLPEKRADFYAACIRALLEEWGDRRPRFSVPRKKKRALALLAYEHLSSPEHGNDVSKTMALQCLGRSMEAQGLSPGDDEPFLQDIVEHSGVLVKRGNAYNFPHRTFMEYLAAWHAVEELEPREFIEVYRSDPARWREVLLLYCGACPDVERLLPIFDALREESGSTTNSPRTNALRLAALLDADKLPAHEVEEILDHTEAELDRAPTREVIEQLGHLSGNPNRIGADRAVAILEALLDEAVELKVDSKLNEPDLFEGLIVAVLKRPKPETVETVTKAMQSMNPAKLLPAMGESGLQVCVKIFQGATLTQERRRAWIDGLARAGAVQLLWQLACSTDLDSDTRRFASYAIAASSSSTALKQLLDDTETSAPPNDPSAEQVFTQWSWPFDLPLSEKGQRIQCFLASQLAEREKEERPLAVGRESIDPRVSFLAGAVWKERRYHRRSRTWRLKPPIVAGTPRWISHAIWTLKREDPSEPWHGSPLGYLARVALAVPALAALGWLIGSYAWSWGSSLYGFLSKTMDRDSAFALYFMLGSGAGIFFTLVTIEKQGGNQSRALPMLLGFLIGFFAWPAVIILLILVAMVASLAGMLEALKSTWRSLTTEDTDQAVIQAWLSTWRYVLSAGGIVASLVGAWLLLRTDLAPWVGWGLAVSLVASALVWLPELFSVVSHPRMPTRATRTVYNFLWQG